MTINLGLKTPFRKDRGFLFRMEILKFIQAIRESFIGSEIVYTTGSCYKFYLILKEVFPQANAYYNSDHVITEINGIFYDITGEVERTNHLLMSDHYPESGVKDCIYVLHNSD